MEIGTICVKTQGREKGRKCVIVDTIDKNCVLVTGPRSVTGIKRRKVSVRHLSSTGERVDVKKGATDKEVEEALRKTLG